MTKTKEQLQSELAAKTEENAYLKTEIKRLKSEKEIPTEPFKVQEDPESLRRELNETNERLSKTTVALKKVAELL